MANRLELVECGTCYPQDATSHAAVHSMRKIMTGFVSTRLCVPMHARSQTGFSQRGASAGCGIHLSSRARWFLKHPITTRYA